MATTITVTCGNVTNGTGDIRAKIDAVHILVDELDQWDDDGNPKRYRLHIVPDDDELLNDVSSGLSVLFTPNADGQFQWDGYIFPAADDYLIQVIDEAQASSDADVIETSSEEDPTELTTAAPHGLTSGETVIIADHVGSTPDINGTHVVTVTGDDTFTIDVEVTVAGTGGTATTAGVILTEEVTVI